jgi:hypothetical protein
LQIPMYAFAEKLTDIINNRSREGRTGKCEFDISTSIPWRNHNCESDDQ